MPEWLLAILLKPVIAVLWLAFLAFWCALGIWLAHRYLPEGKLKRLLLMVRGGDHHGTCVACKLPFDQHPVTRRKPSEDLARLLRIGKQ
jgi:hypothetical protein